MADPDLEFFYPSRIQRSKRSTGSRIRNTATLHVEKPYLRAQLYGTAEGGAGARRRVEHFKRRVVRLLGGQSAQPLLLRHRRAQQTVPQHRVVHAANVLTQTLHKGCMKARVSDAYLFTDPDPAF
jgi:hypothetical protein